MSIFGKQGKKKAGTRSSFGKKGGRPKVGTAEGCAVWDEWCKDRHIYAVGGRTTEYCGKCGKEHALITAWRKNITEGKAWSDHPFVEKGYWSHNEYLKYMKK